MASLTLYMSLWFAIILVGMFMYPSHYQSSLDLLIETSTDPVQGFITIMERAFDSITSNWLLSTLTLIAVAAGFYSSYQLGGAGFSILFAIPLLIIVAVFNAFILPTAMLTTTAAGIPEVVRYIFLAFIGLLTIMTGIQFTAGRS